MKKRNFKFREGLVPFHENTNINFQLNRWTGYGCCGRDEDVQKVANRIKKLSDHKVEMIKIAKEALVEERLLNAAWYYRGAEFFCKPDDPDRIKLYDKFIDLFYEVFKEDNIERFKIPYQNSYLPAYRINSNKSIGTILVHGGFDSFIEEFYPQLIGLKESDYDIIVFEGPGQGAAINKYHLPMTHKWETPVRAVLDYFKLNDVTLIGISLGGYLALRAAAYEKRIKRVIAYDIIYNTFDCFMSKQGRTKKLIISTLLGLNADFILNTMFKKSVKKDMLTEWLVTQGMHVWGAKTPAEYLKNVKLYHCEDCSKLITQDVLLLAGTKDHFVPLEMIYKQTKALTNAKSITSRIFTEKENAADHCQIGNLKLTMDVITNWINETRGNGII